MCDTTFAFGQRGSHFFQCPSRREHIRLPTKLSTLLSSSQLALVHHVALGFQDSFLLTWRDNTGEDHVESSGLPEELVSFLYARSTQGRLTRDIANIRCTLGPYNSSFFVHDKSAYLWMNLSKKLLSAIESRVKNGDWTDRPRVVALGAGDDFILVTENHAAVWNLNNYRTVSSLLEYSHMHQGGISEIHNIILHPYRFQSFITQFKTGKLVYENLPPHGLPNVQAMASHVIRDSEEMERKPLLRQRSEQREFLPRRESMPRRASALQQRAQLRREWSEHSQEISKQAKGLKISLSLSVNLGGLARMLG